MNHEVVIELDNVTLEDCVELYEKKSIKTIISNGRVENFVEEE